MVFKELSKLSDKMKQTKLRWLQIISQRNGDNTDDVRCKASRSFRTQKRKYLKDKINELETDSKNRSIRDLHRDIN
jgi:hypothetical protein